MVGARTADRAVTSLLAARGERAAVMGETTALASEARALTDETQALRETTPTPAKAGAGGGTDSVAPPLMIEHKSAKALRNERGKATGGESLPVIREGDRWLRGTHANAGKIPGQIAEQLRGREFKDFNDFKTTFWKIVADDPVLSKSFKQSDLNNMRNGLAPQADITQWKGGNKSYNLHHETPLQHGGATYDVDNIRIVTPRYHEEVLNPKYHKGRR